MFIHTLTFVALLLPSAPPEVHLRTLEGKSLRGKLVNISEKTLSVENNGVEDFVNPRLIHTVGIHDTAAMSRWRMQVALLDGSLLHCVDYSVTDEQAKLRFADGSQQAMPVRQVRSVLLRNSGNDLYRDWRNYLRENSATDRLIVRRSITNKANPTATAISLDVMEGIVGNVAADGVRFELEGDALKVKREKAEGLIYFRRPTSLASEAICYAVDLDGSRWAVKTLTTSDTELRWETPTGIKLAMPWQQLRELDFFSANAVYLSPQGLDTTKRGSYLSEKDASRVTEFAPLFDRTPDGSIQCGGKEITHGIWLPAPSSLTFNVPEKYSRLSLLAGFDDRIGDTDGALLSIEADGKTLFSQVITRGPQLLPITVELHQAKRVRISANYGGESHLGDTLILSEAMFIR